MIQNTVAYGLRQIQTGAVLFQHIQHAQTLLIMMKMAEQIANRKFTDMTERRMSHVMPQGDRFRQIFIQAQRTRHRPRDLAHFQCMRHPRAIMIRRRDIYLRLVFQASKRLAMQNPIPIPLVFGAQRILILWTFAHGVTAVGSMRR